MAMSGARCKIIHQVCQRELALWHDPATRNAKAMAMETSSEIHRRHLAGNLGLGQRVAPLSVSSLFSQTPLSNPCGGQPPVLPSPGTATRLRRPPHRSRRRPRCPAQQRRVLCWARLWSCRLLSQRQTLLALWRRSEHDRTCRFPQSEQSTTFC